MTQRMTTISINTSTRYTIIYAQVRYINTVCLLTEGTNQ